MAGWITPLKKQVHPRWEYSDAQDPTQESSDNIEASKLVELLGEMFKSTSNWSTPKQVRTYHLQVERDPIRQQYLNFHLYLDYLFFICLLAGFG
jgi:hypothetical protein